MAANTYDHILTKGPESALPATPEDGKLRLTTDTGRLFIDGQSSRTEVTDFVKGLTEEQIKAQLAPLTSKIYISSDTNKFMVYNADAQEHWDIVGNGAEAEEATHASTADFATNASTSAYATNAATADYATNAGSSSYATNAGTSVYATNAGTAVHVTDGVKSIASGTTNGSVNVNVNGTTADVAVKGLKALAYKDSLSNSDVGLGNVANINQSKAIASITRSGTTFTATALDGSTTSFTQQDNNTTYAAGAGIALNSGTFSNSGVRSVAQGSTNGTINVNTNGTTADVSVKGLGTAAFANVTDTYSSTGTTPVSGKAVAEAIADLPEPMIFKGSLGTGGTITTLPTAAASNEGFTYKVITAGTYASQEAKVGDTFISDGSAWVLIPSGDEPSGTVTSVGITAGDGISVSGSPITTSGSITVTNKGVRSIATGTTAGTINVNTNGATADVAVKDAGKGIKSITRSGTTFTATAIDGSTFSFDQQDNNTTYAAANGIALNSGTFSNSGVRSIASGGSNGTINVNTNGTTADVAVKGLGALAYKDSLGSSDVGLGNVANINQSKAISNITRSGTTFTATALDGSTFSFTQQDNNTTYAAANGVALNNGTFSNSGVRAVAEGGANGTINVNTNGSTANIAVHGLGALAYKDSLSKSDVGLGNVANLDQSKAIKSITRSGTTFTATAIDGSTSSFTQQDNNTTYTGANGIALSGTTFSNSGVRAIATGTTNGTINVNTNGSTADVAVKGLGSNAYSSTDYLPLTGGIVTGCITLQGTLNDYREGIRINEGANGYSTLLIGSASGTSSGTRDGAFWIGTNATSQARKLFITHHGSIAETFFYASSASDNSPSLQLGGELKIGGNNGPTIKYNTTTQSIDFIFA